MSSTGHLNRTDLSNVADHDVLYLSGLAGHVFTNYCIEGYDTIFRTITDLMQCCFGFTLKHETTEDPCYPVI